MLQKVKLEDIESEKLVIAGLLKDSKKIDRAMLSLTPNQFNGKIYKHLFVLATKIYAKHGSLVTNDLLSNFLESNGQPQEVRLRYLKEVDNLRTTEINDAEFSFAISCVKKAFLSKSVADILSRATKKLESKGGADAFREIDRRLYDLKLATVNSENLVVIDTRKVDDILDRFKDMRENPEKYKGMPSGWRTLDRVTGGFQKGEYVLIIAPTGGGKSMGLINWANHAQRDGYNVVYVSLEMPHWEIRMRQLSAEAEIPYLNLKLQTLNVGEINKQEAVLKNEIATRESAFYVVDLPKATVGFIEAQLRQLQQTMPIDAVFIDYLGLLKPEVNVRNRHGWEIAANISQDLRDLARTMNITVVTAHQVTTDGMKKTTDEDLELGDIALSRRIADPAHTVVGLLWDKTQPGEMKLCVPKCRGGRIASAKLWCNLDICKITDMPGSEGDAAIVAPDASDLEV